MKTLTQSLVTAAALTLAANLGFAMESAPKETSTNPGEKEYMEQLGKSADSVLKGLGREQYSGLMDAFSGNGEAKGLLSKAMDMLKSGNDSGALETLNKLGNVKMTDSQKQLYSEFKKSADVYVMGNSFDTSDPAVSGPVNNTIAAIQTGDSIQAAQGLQELYGMSELTAEQKEIVARIAAQYNGVDLSGLDKAQKAAGSVKDML